MVRPTLLLAGVLLLTGCSTGPMTPGGDERTTSCTQSLGTHLCGGGNDNDADNADPSIDVQGVGRRTGH
jgi:hypothetical protein